MNIAFETYKPRRIVPNGKIKINNWFIKLYTITNKLKFESQTILANVVQEIPKWLLMMEATELDVYKQAFIIVHEAREGVWILLNWWTGGEMIQTEVYFSSYDKPKKIAKTPFNTSSLLCVWELEVFAHERQSWINNILLKADSPDFISYEKDVLSN